MANNIHKKQFRVFAHGNAKPYGQWSERISTAKIENRKERRFNKIICYKMSEIN